MKGSTLVIVLGLAFASPASGQTEIRVLYTPDRVPTTAEDPAWTEAPEAWLSLRPQSVVPPTGGGAVSDVAMRAMHDGERIALHLEWADDTADRSVGLSDFRDAAAVGFPLGESETPPSPFMGDANHPVAIWQWTADLEARARGRETFPERYPHTDGVWYFPQDAEVRRQVRAWRGDEPVIAFVASGFGTLRRVPTRNVFGSSTHADGRWRVVLHQPIATGDPEEASFKPGERTSLIVAIWDGSKGDVNGRKSVTFQWTPFVLDTTLERRATEESSDAAR